MKLKLSIGILLLLLILLPGHAFAASGITLDGQFSDWTDKPGLQDTRSNVPAQQDMVSVKWLPDSSDENFYMYCERLDGMNENKNNPNAVDWDFEVNFSSDQGTRTAFVSYHPESRFVDVSLKDARGDSLWSSKGKWGDDKYSARRVEFSIPLSFLASSPSSGYQFDMSFNSSYDRVPDTGSITISTASTFPYFSAVLMLLWVLLLVFLHRQGLHFFKFIAGSVGLFLILMFLGSGYYEKQMEYMVTWCMWLIGRLTGIFTALPVYSLITVYHGLQAVSFLVDFECAGMIEILVYVSLLAFYPVYGLVKRLAAGLGGVVFIFAANIFRVFTICGIIKVFGTPMFFLSHTVLARILFFALMVVLYYVIFTQPHILKQKVGNLKYD